MIRRLFAVAIGLIFLPWQGPLVADAAADEPVAGDPVTSVSALGLQYQRLQAQLERFRELDEAGGWLELPDGATIHPGLSDPRLAALATRLTVSGDLADADPSVSTLDYNATLQGAVRRFQARHGLEVDALVGPATRRALNVPVQQRIDQIRVNLERVRRLRDAASDDLILVNIAAFKAYVIRDGAIEWTTKVIVGDTRDETPLFSSELKSVVFNPTWSIPHSIASKELLPKIKQDPGFLSRGGYQLYDHDGSEVDPSAVDWSRVATRNFPFTMVQRPGPANQLGQIKFMTPNPYSVCMHDTPAKSLFANAKRAFSHGCIRVDDPVTLAELVLSSEGWTRQKIDSEIKSAATKTVALAEPLPVVVSYWTAEVDDLGVIHFHEDIYERDAADLRALDKVPASDQHNQPATDS